MPIAALARITLGTWLMSKNPRTPASRLPNSWRLITVALIAFGLVGCGGGGGEAEVLPEDPSSSDAYGGGGGGGESEAPSEAPGSSESEESSSGYENVAGNDSPPEQPQQPQGPPPKPPRSTNFASWKDEDYKDAVRERDGKVVEAIKWLSTNRKTDDSAKLVRELLALANEPAVDPPPKPQQPGSAGNGGGRAPQSANASSGGGRAPVSASASGGGGGGRAPVSASASGGGGGGNGRTPMSNKASSGGSSGETAPALDGGTSLNLNQRGHLDDLFLGDIESFLLTTSVGWVQNGPPPGYGGGGGRPEGYDSGAGQDGPPPGYQDGGKPSGYDDGSGQDGPPPGYSEGGFNYGDGTGGQDGPPAGYSESGGYDQGQQSGNSNPAPNNPAPPASAPTGYGTLNMDEFVSTSVDALFTLDSPTAWTTLKEMLEGTFKLPIPTEGPSDQVLFRLVETYGGPGHPSHKMLMGMMDSPRADHATEVFTGYAMGAMDILLGTKQAGGGVAAAGGAPSPFRGGRGARANGPAAGGAGAGGATAPGLESPGGAPDVGAGGATAPSLDGGEFGPPAGSPGGLGSGPGGANGLSRGPRPGGGGNNSTPPPNTPALDIVANPRPISAEAMPHVTAFLLNPEFTDRIASMIAQQSSIAEKPQVLALASALPTLSVRKATLGLLNSQFQGGALSLRATSFFSRIARDPGMLVVLKSLPKNDNYEANNRLGSWNESTKELALATRDRLRAAANSGGNSGSSSFPVPLHKGASPSVTYSASWPTAVSGQIGEGGAVGSMRVWYTRIDIASVDARTFKSIKSHYERRSGARNKKHAVDEGRRIFWYTNLRAGTAGAKRSIDVIFSEAAGNGGGGGGARSPASLAGGAGGGAAGGGMAIEIIVVETGDPNLGDGLAQN